MKKIDKDLIIGFGFFVFCILIIIIIIFNIIFLYKSYKIKYEFGINNKEYYSNNCYIKNDTLTCDYKGNQLEVDWYGEVNK